MAATQFFVNYLEHFSYLGIFIFVLLSGYLIPIPEEVLLLLVGYIGGLGINNVYMGMIVAMLGVLAGDNVLFWLSKYKGSKLVDRLKYKIRKSELIKYRQLMKKHIGKTIFIVRFIVGLRFFGPFLAGSMKVGWKTFQLYNLLAVVVYVPIIVFLGFHFHNQLASIITKLEIARHLVFFFFLLIVGYLINRFINKRFLVKKNKTG